MNWNIKEIQEAAKKINLSDDKLLDLLAALPKQRSIKENSCIHMYFNLAAQELNEIGHTFQFVGLKGQIIEMQWTGELFKNTIWKQLLLLLTDKESTTKSTNADIKLIYEALAKWFAEKGIYIPYPSSENEDFSEYMKKLKNNELWYEKLRIRW